MTITLLVAAKALRRLCNWSWEARDVLYGTEDPQVHMMQGSALTYCGSHALRLILCLTLHRFHGS